MANIEMHDKIVLQLWSKTITFSLIYILDN